MDTKWSPDLIADYIAKYCNQKSSIDGEEGKINMIVTFDGQGVSGHPNHGAVYDGVATLMEKRLVSDMEVLTLSSVHFLRKYIAFADCNFLAVD